MVQYEDEAAFNKARTAKDFTEDLCKAGRTDEQVVLAARVTRWKSLLDEVKDWLKKRGQVWREVGKEQRRQEEKDRKNKPVETVEIQKSPRKSRAASTGQRKKGGPCGVEVFKEAFAGNEPQKREVVEAKLREAGLAEHTIRMYFYRATKANKPVNPFGFILQEQETAAGTVWRKLVDKK